MISLLYRNRNVSCLSPHQLMAKISEFHGSQRGTEHVASSCRSTFAPRRPSSARLCPVVRPRASTRRPRRAGSRSVPNHKDPGFRPNSQEIAENLDEFWHFGVHFLGARGIIVWFLAAFDVLFLGYYIRETWKWNTLGAKTTGSCKIANENQPIDKHIQRSHRKNIQKLFFFHQQNMNI